MGDVTENTDPKLPVAIAPRPAMSIRARPALDSGFISQLIAERDQLPSQRRRRQAPVRIAIEAYHQGERRDARRLPQGFFRTAEA